MPKLLKILNNKINKNRSIYIANKSLKQIYNLKQTFLWAIALQAYLYINIYRNLFVGLFITKNPANRLIKR